MCYTLVIQLMLNKTHADKILFKEWVWQFLSSHWWVSLVLFYTQRLHLNPGKSCQKCISFKHFNSNMEVTTYIHHHYLKDNSKYMAYINDLVHFLHTFSVSFCWYARYSSKFFHLLPSNLHNNPVIIFPITQVKKLRPREIQ